MRPTFRLIALVGVLAALAAFGLDQDTWRASVAVLLGVALVDLTTARRQSAIAVERRLAPNLAVNRPAEVTLLLAHGYGRKLKLTLRDRVPAELAPFGLPAQVVVPSGEGLAVGYEIQPKSRGEFELTALDYTVDSPLGLWQIRRSRTLHSETRVYPDFSAIARYLEMVTDHRVSRLGIKLTPRRGEGLEFHQLREYREGDALRQIDWKATSRRRELISREYQEERDQRLLFLVDNGRRMRSMDGELSHFDHALNAMLLLSYVALRQGDSVSLLSFGESKRWVPPVRGVGAVSTLLNEVYDLQTGAVASDYIAAAEEAMSLQRKRALIVVLTNLREEDADLPVALSLLAQRHVVLLANLRESSLDHAMEQPVRRLRDALAVSGAVSYAAERRETQKSLHNCCHLVIDSLARELPIRVVNSYWQIKRSGTL